jgi:hypothetical protein
MRRKKKRMTKVMRFERSRTMKKRKKKRLKEQRGHVRPMRAKSSRSMGKDVTKDTRHIRTLYLHTIDGFWIQQQISEIYSDPVTAADKASSVLSILGSKSSLRGCENQLKEPFDNQNHHVIRAFIKDRDAIIWCTKLMRSDADEHVDIEVAMREKGTRALVGLYANWLEANRQKQQIRTPWMSTKQNISVLSILPYIIKLSIPGIWVIFLVTPTKIVPCKKPGQRDEFESQGNLSS